MERLDKIEEKLDRIENKIDGFIDVSSTHKSDISWLKGITKINFTLLTTAVTAIIGWLIRIAISK
jgi:archaellum component FlaC